MRVLDLFSGIGGFSLGLERAGFRTVAFCEIEPYCRAILARHWPGVPILGDITQVKAQTVADATKLCSNVSKLHGNDAHHGREPRGSSSQIVDVICGGFPCQDISYAGKGAGLAGARSGLWIEYARLVGELRPKYVIVENVSALCSRGLGTVLGDLASIGYDAEWHCIPASHVGAPHRRDRVWIVAYPNGAHGQGGRIPGGIHPQFTHPDIRSQYGDAKQVVADPECGGSPGSGQYVHAGDTEACQVGEATQLVNGSVAHQWRSEPDVGRVAHGVPARVHRLRALGNAVVPQVVEIIGRAIMRMEYP